MKITLQRTSPNYRQKLSTHRIMRDLTIALLVLIAYSLYYYYYNYMTNDPVIHVALMYVVSLVVALATEVVWALIHKEKVFDYLKNSFGWVTAIIFTLTLPAGTPLYVTAIGSFISIFFGKLVYGGFGQNIFNPALVGRVVVHLAFGGQLVANISDTVNGIDVATKATPITMLAGTSWLGGDTFTYTLSDLFLGNHAGALGETCIVLILILGIVLAARRVFDARIPVAYMGTILVLSEVFALVNGLDPITYPMIHFCLGGAMFGAVFMATDPVTSPSSPLGKILYGICLGFLTMIIRLKANYPEGVLFSILMMNMLTPLIDSFVLGRTDQNVGKQWASIAISLVVAIACVFGISTGIKNDVAAAEQEAIEAQKQKEEEEKKKAEEEANQVQWTYLETTDDGYVMQVSGFGGEANPMKVAVKIDGDTITSVKVLEYAGETAGFGKDLIESGSGGNLNEKAQAFHDQVLNGSLSTSDVDGIDTSTGATMTSNGIVNAIKGAIEQAQKAPVVDGDTYTYTLTANGFGGEANPMTIKVSVNKATETVTDVEVVEYAGETAGFGKDLIEAGTGGNLNEKAQAFYDDVLNGEISWDDVSGIDTSTGATLTTKGIVNAIQEAIDQTK